MFKVVHLRPRLDNAVSSSRDRTFPLDATLAMIQTLIDCDEFQDIATLRVCELFFFSAIKKKYIYIFSLLSHIVYIYLYISPEKIYNI